MSPHFQEISHDAETMSSPDVSRHGNGTYMSGAEYAAEQVPALTSTITPAQPLAQRAAGTTKPVYTHRSPYLQPSSPGSVFDLVCIGFGPASLAIAAALHDALAGSPSSSTFSYGNQTINLPDGRPPRVLFLEKQSQFAWHAGMLLPGAKMQISFIKDLATLRDPRSEFTFLNYLHTQGRLVDFTNLSTFLPARVEYEDYLRWCAAFFEDVVQYSNEVVSVSPMKQVGGAMEASVDTFRVTANNTRSGAYCTYEARNVLLATGGQPSIPRHLPAKHPRVIHSSQYAHLVPKILNDRAASYRVAVLGAGQSAAEIFHNIHALYPNSQTRLIMRPEFLRPSDDSPFVNSIFNPEYVDSLYPKSHHHRSHLLSSARATNYGVVRLELIEELYTQMYEQRRCLGTDESVWPHRIMGGRTVTSATSTSSNTLNLTIRTVEGLANGFVESPDAKEETWEADLVIAATGYQRTAHLDILKDVWSLLPTQSMSPDQTSSLCSTPTSSHSGLSSTKGSATEGWTVSEPDGTTRKLCVGRDYRVKSAPGTISPGSGIWLQGCCEATHGLSDTLLSVLATRSAEIVQSIFGQAQQ